MMAQASQIGRALNIVYFYAHEVNIVSELKDDKKLVDQFNKHISSLKNQGTITLWNDQQNITGGSDRHNEIMSHIDSADIILFFLSADFIDEYASKSNEKYKYSNTYMEHAIKQQRNYNTRIIPIILRLCEWKDSSLAPFQPLPQNGEPITTQKDIDEAWVGVTEAIKRVIAEEEYSHRLAPLITDNSIDELIPLQNKYFIGRELLLNVLRDKLTREKTSGGKPVAIVGLGGVGKTQLAIEYIWRYRNQYNFVLWAKADTPNTLASELFRLANKLSHTFADKDDESPNVIIRRVKEWLQENSNWLMVLDNVCLDEADANQANTMAMASIIRELPANGHILMTTRSQSLLMKSLADLVVINNLSEEEAKTLLLLRAGFMTREESARSIDSPSGVQELAVDILGCLPLAIDQAGAYINLEQCGIDGYIRRYQEEGAQLMGTATDQEPGRETVATTWKVSFDAVEKVNKIAAELLKALSFLAAGAIPEEIILEGSSELGTILGGISSVLDLDAVVKTLEDYSLLQRNKTTRLLIIHRLVQEVLRDNLSKDITKRNKIKAIWAERVVRAVNCVFPDGSLATWERCQNCQASQVCPVKNLCSNKRLTLSQRCLPHAQVCVQYIEDYDFRFSEAAELLHHTASYLHSYDAHYDQANIYYARALQIRQFLSQKTMLDTAVSHNDLARLYRDQYEYNRAKKHFEDAITIFDQQLGSSDPLTAHSKSSLARLYLIEGHYKEAEELFLSALDTHQRNQLKNHSTDAAREVAKSTYGLAQLYHKEDRYKEARERYEQVLAIDQTLYGPRHLITAQCLDSLGCLYHDLGDFTRAERHLLQSLDIRKSALEGAQKSRHPDTAQSLNDLGGLYSSLGRYKEAEELIKEALGIRRAALNSPQAPDDDRHPDIAQSYSYLASLYKTQQRYQEAEECYLKALDINRRILGDHHPYTAHNLSSLADLYFNQGRYEEAEQFTMKAYVIREELDGPTPAEKGQSLYNMARLFYAKKDYTKAEEYYKKTLAIDEEKLGSRDPRTVMVRKLYTELLQQMGRDEELH